jgi:ABC-type transport system substrate-binding protein
MNVAIRRARSHEFFDCTGAYMATTFLSKFEGLAMSPFATIVVPHGSRYGMYMPDHPLNKAHVNDPQSTAMLKEQMRTKDLEARTRIIGAIQRYAEQQYYIYMNSTMITSSWQPSVKNYAPNFTWDYGDCAAALWLER